MIGIVTLCSASILSVKGYISANENQAQWIIPLIWSLTTSGVEGKDACAKTIPSHHLTRLENVPDGMPSVTCLIKSEREYSTISWIMICSIGR